MIGSTFSTSPADVMIGSTFSDSAESVDRSPDVEKYGIVSAAADAAAQSEETAFEAEAVPDESAESEVESADAAPKVAETPIESADAADAEVGAQQSKATPKRAAIPINIKLCRNSIFRGSVLRVCIIRRGVLRNSIIRESVLRARIVRKSMLRNDMLRERISREFPDFIKNPLQPSAGDPASKR